MRKLDFEGNRNVISRQLKVMRAKCGISQEQLAARMQVMSVNLNQQEISKIENNARFVSDFELAALCKALQCTEQELLQDFYNQIEE